MMIKKIWGGENEWLYIYFILWKLVLMQWQMWKWMQEKIMSNQLDKTVFYWKIVPFWLTWNNSLVKMKDLNKWFQIQYFLDGHET